MQKDDFIEILTNELAHEYESDIEKVLVFYKNGEKLMISTGDKEIQVEKIDLPEDDCGCYEETDYNNWKVEVEVKAEAEADHSTVTNNIKNQVEVAKENILSYGTQIIQLPTGRRINVIN
ncbi:hypothetical protein Desor_2015 [Desulfosporosinus orientis DSM 765]|uniref:Uncharacterized protein n=1 Tax=Desulfosporosinus orientis (strain ATCC 19365 / DSM 765 / NCIMB 8382 / VKM B-1628 / Singapore I) TaxID=768706 RepID=G7WF13_DESOD|nr:hypothetical protein [Desulfosporosinus orientis]AET67624.1 hypothetical protein Desor_2015 [Desulfosporosinus orientis DSM 765]